MYRRLASAVILALGFLFSVSARPAADRSAAAGLEFRLSDSGAVTITGYTGAARTLAIPSRIEKSPVTGIGDDAFAGNANLTTVTIPSSVTSIGNSAFTRTGLTNITIPPSVTSIGDDAFRNTRLTNLSIPQSVISIGARAFSDNAVLTAITVDSGNPAYIGIDGVLFDKNVQTLLQYPGARQGSAYTIPASVSAVGERAFTGNRNLTDITIPSSVVSIGNFAFSNTGLTTVTIPASVTSIGDRAFDGAALTGITVNAQNPAYTDTDGVLFDKNMQTLLQYPVGRQENTYLIPSSVISIGDRAFSNNRNLTGITIPPSVTSIGNSAFSSTGLTVVTIPGSVASIGNSAFSSTFLTTVTIPASTVSLGNFVFDSINVLSGIIVNAQNPAYAAIDGVLFDKNIQTLIKYPAGKQESAYAVPPSVSSIADRAFDNNRNLTGVTLPPSVVSIGDRAFSNNRNLASITLPPSVVSIGSRAFDSTSLTHITIPLSVTFIGIRAFADNARLTAIDVDNGNAAYAGIDGVLFDKGIQTLLQYPGNKQESAYTIPPSVSSIADRAFAGNANLTSVTLPPSVASIGNSAFLRTGITNVAIPASVAFIGNSAFDGTNSLTNFNVDKGNRFYAGSDGALFDKSMQTLLQYPAGRQESAYTVPRSVNFIGNRAFAESRNLTAVTIPASVVSIGNSAFLRSGLTGITIPQSVTLIGNSAFDDNAGLTNINVNAQNPAYASVDGVLFDKTLETLIRYPGGRQGAYNVPQSVKAIGNRAFANSINLTGITVPSSVVSIGNSAFLRTGLTSITIPASVTSIGGSAFDGTALTSITIPPSVASIGNSAFIRTGLTAVTLSRKTLVGRNVFPLDAEISYID